MGGKKFLCEQWPDDFNSMTSSDQWSEELVEVSTCVIVTVLTSGQSNSRASSLLNGGGLGHSKIQL